MAGIRIDYDILVSLGLACAIAPYLLARLHPLLGPLTRPLVYLLVAAQVLAFPVLVWLDPVLDFGSDTYSLGAGISIALIFAIEMIFIVGSGAGLLAATAFLERREQAAAVQRWRDFQSGIGKPD